MRSVPWRPFVLLLLVLSPTLVLAVLLGDPQRNSPLFIPVEHFVITTNVSIVALLVAVFVARADGIQLRPLGEAQVRGRSEAVTIFTPG